MRSRKRPSVSKVKIDAGSSRPFSLDERALIDCFAGIAALADPETAVRLLKRGLRVLIFGFELSRRSCREAETDCSHGREDLDSGAKSAPAHELRADIPATRNHEQAGARAKIAGHRADRRAERHQAFKRQRQAEEEIRSRRRRTSACRRAAQHLDIVDDADEKRYATETPITASMKRSGIERQCARHRMFRLTAVRKAARHSRGTGVDRSIAFVTRPRTRQASRSKS